MCWCSWLRIDAAWLQWISSKNYSINSAAVALDGISAGKSLSALPYLDYKWLPALPHQLLKPWGWTWSKARAPYPILSSWSQQCKIGWFIQGEKHLHKNITRCVWGLPAITLLPEAPELHLSALQQIPAQPPTALATNIQCFGDSVSTADSKHTAISRVLKNKTSVHLSVNNPYGKSKRYNRGKNK